MVRFWPFITALFCVTATPLLGYAAMDATAQNTQTNQALLNADIFEYDQEKGIFTASGNVELYQDDQMIQADLMQYDHINDVVYAEGNVRFIDKTGQVYFSDKVKLEQKFKTGVIEQLWLVFADGSRFAASSGERKDENTIIMRNGVYSPCSLCEDDKQKDPMWQIRAGKAVYDKKSQDIYYHNVKLDAYGVPIAYVPYFSHPSPEVKARSGILMPRFSTDSKKGFTLRNYYYQNISPSQDMTVELSPTQDMGTVLGLEWRKNFERGNIIFSGSANESEVVDGNGNVLKPEKLRGHILANGIYNINSDWQAGFNARKTFDNLYLRDFEYSTEDILTSNIYVQRLHDRNFTNINMTSFQDLRPTITQDQSDILPSLRHNAYGDPNDMFGGRWNVDNQFITLFRNGSQSVSRLSTVPSWERRDILPFGARTTVSAKLRADGYWVRQDSPFNAVPGASNIDRTVGRLMPSTQAIVAYPLVRPSDSITALIEPKVGLRLAPNTSNTRIPNEDSRDAQIDINNLFFDNRFPGVDRIESGSHASYGVKMGGFHNNGNSAFFTIGQSYRLTDNNPFPQGSGLEGDRSDIVGQFEATLYDRFYADYRFQVDESDLENRRHELQATYADDGLEFRTNYTFAQAIQGTGLGNNRQQLGFSAAKALTQNWAVAADTLHDLSGESGFLKGGLALQYKNDCFRATLRGERDLTDQLLGGSDNRVLFSLGLRNLGGYDSPLLENDPLYQPFGIGGRL